MATANTVKGLDSVKVPKLDQKHINAIEKRLVLFGGSTLPEFGVDLVNKYGKTVDEIKALQAQTVNLDAAIEEAAYKNGIDRQTARRKLMRDIREKITGKKEERKAEETGFMLAAKKYIIEEYGDEKRDGNGDLRGYGDRIEMVGKGHLKKIW